MKLRRIFEIKLPQLKLKFFILACLICPLSVFSQVIPDNNNQTTIIPADDPNESLDVVKDGDDNKSSTLSETLAFPVKKYSDSFNPMSKKKGFTMNQDSDLVDPGVIYEKKWSKQERETASPFQGDQFLGQFDTNSKFVNVIYRDHEYPDGDRIRVYLNDDVIRPNVLLTQGFSGFKVDLLKGINKLDFQALNQGESGPNTAEFHVYDDNENLVSANRWNLSTGSIATIIVVKE